MGITKYYVDVNGVYLGAFEDSTPTQQFIEVPSAPQRADQIWDFINSIWTTPTPILESIKVGLLDKGRLMRETVLGRLNGILGQQLRIVLKNQTPEQVAAAWVVIDAVDNTINELKDITIWPDVVSAVDGDVKVAFLTRYYQIVAELELVSPYAVTAFRNLDL